MAVCMTQFALTKDQHWKRQPLNSLQWPIYVFNSVDNTKLPCYTPSDTTQQFLRKLIPITTQLPLSADNTSLSGSLLKALSALKTSVECFWEEV